MLYLYAVTSTSADISDQRAAPAGIEQFQLGNLYAVFERIDRAPVLATAALQRHDEIVRYLCSCCDAVLPARFAQTFTDEQHLAAMLTDSRTLLTSALEQVAGCLQMTLRVFKDAPTAARVPMGGADYLRARAAAARSREESLHELQEHLEGCIEAERVLHHGTPPLIASLYHLVRRENLERYSQRLGESQHCHYKLSSSGPWAPYAFAGDIVG